MRDLRRQLRSQNQEAVLQATSDRLLAEAGLSVPDWEFVSQEIVSHSGELLADAQADFNAFETLRARVLHRYGRADPVMCVLAGVVAGYVLLVIAGPRFLPWAAANPGVGLTPLILAVLAVAFGIQLTLWLLRRTALMRAVAGTRQQWVNVLRDQVLRPFIVEWSNVEKRNPRLFDTSIGQEYPPRFIVKGTEPRRLVKTEAMKMVEVTAQNVESGSLGVSGPRGVGKSTILQFFGSDTAADNGGDLRLVVSAPVDYEAQEFILHLFGKLCEAVPHGSGERSKLAEETRRCEEQLVYLRTYTTSWSASLSPKAFLTLARGYAKQRAEQPVTLPQLVERFRKYSEQVAASRQSADGGGGRLVIGIDEVDKIRDSDRAEAFLNDIKAIFGVPGSLYIVSLSEDALAGFARRTPSIRSAFDSAFDELVPVGPMTYRHSEQMLFKRVSGVPRPCIALCHVLAGGLPRDLVRVARALIAVRPSEGEKSLPDTAKELIRGELESLRQASVRQFADQAAPAALLEELHRQGWPGETPAEFTRAARKVAGTSRDAESDSLRELCQELVVSLSFYATALEVFSAPAEGRLLACLKEQNDAIIDDLAAARFATRMNAGLAHRLLEQYRLDQGIVVPPEARDGAGQWHRLGLPCGGWRGDG
jgi:hypothetical protein